MSQPTSFSPNPNDSSFEKITPNTRRLQTPRERFGESAAFSEAAFAEQDGLDDPFLPLPDSHAELQRLAPRHHPRRFERVNAKTARGQKHEVRHFERHVLPGHNAPHATKTVRSSVTERAAVPEGEARERAMETLEHKRFSREAARRQKLARITKRTLVLCALFFAAQLGFAAFSAPQFAVMGVQIEGVKDTPLAAVDPIAQKLIGQNIFRANSAAIEQSLTKISTVASARVERSLSYPPKMRVLITERQPIGRVGAGRSWWAVDASGLPFRRADKPADQNLYALTSPQFSPRQGRLLPAKTWARARRVLIALQKDNARHVEHSWRLRRVYVDENGLTSLRVSDDRHPELLVRLGEDEFARKLKRARQSLDYLHRTGRRAEELNLISFQIPRWKPKPPQSGETGTLAHKSNSSGATWG